QKSGERHQPTTQQSSHRNHGHYNDRHGSDRRGGGDNHRSSNNNYSGNNNRNSDNGRDQRNMGQQSNRSANSGSQQSRGPSEGYSYPVCTTCGRRHPREYRRAAGTCFKCGQASHLQKDCKKNTTASTSGQADKKPGASGRVFAITEDHATRTSGTITGTLFIYGHAVFVLFDTGATHYVISSAFASRVTTTPTLLDHVLCISTPMQDSVRITHVYRDLPLQFDDKICAINTLPLDMCKFDIILGMDWLTEHHAMIDCRSYRVIFGDIHAPEFIYHGSLPGKFMQIISALQAQPISKAPYRMASIELKELKDQLQELLERGFIRPSVSPWGKVFNQSESITVEGCTDTYENYFMDSVHVRDVALAHILVYENTSATARHVCVEAITYYCDFADKVAELYPKYNILRYCRYLPVASSMILYGMTSIKVKDTPTLASDDTRISNSCLESSHSTSDGKFGMDNHVLSSTSAAGENP
nr:hypothetical protein [Tanacetum cinerariifolium]